MAYRRTISLSFLAMNITISPLLSSGHLYVCDGGMGSTLSLNGYNIEQDPLWSARLLHTNPQAILKVHEDFVDAGTDILISSSYQASVEGFSRELHLSTHQTEQLIETSVHLARQASQRTNRRIIIAGSVGPYGASKGDGSEYTSGHVTEMTEQQLQDWHKPRVEALLRAGVDVLAVETQPCVKEALAIVKLLKQYPGAKAWVTFACKDGLSTNGGDNFAYGVEQLSQCGGGAGGVLVAVGVNCTSPQLVTPLLNSLNNSVSCVPSADVLPRVVYPNSGETWIPGKGWAEEDRHSGVWRVEEWIEKGARVIGGCCRVAPQHIKELAQTVHNIKKLQ